MGPGRWHEQAARSADLPAVMALCASEEDGPRWMLGLWEGYCQDESAGLLRRSLWLVRGVEGELAGFVATSTVAGVAELEFLLIARRFRRQGVAKQLVASWLRRLAAAGVAEAHLEVRSGNAAARQLYEGMGFCVVGVRPGYYSGPREDAVLMTLQLPTDGKSAEGA